MILFDTDTCIEILRGNKKVLKKRQEYVGDIGLSFMTVGELFYGAENSTHPIQNKSLVENFVLTFTIYHTDFAILQKWGALKSSLKKSHLLVPDADLFIAATCLTKADALITGNSKHFDRIPHLKIENWIR